MNEFAEEPALPYGDEISQNEADRLLKLEKIRVNSEVHVYPSAGEKLNIPIISIDKHENFIISAVPGKIDIKVTRNQIRTKYNNIIISRLDTGTKPHANPDGTIISGAHIHVFKEGYGIRYAYSIDDDKFKGIFKNINDPFQLFQEFMTCCNITKKPIITKE